MNTLRFSLDSFLRHYLLAVQSFTRVPVGAALAGWNGRAAETLRASAPHFPGVGWLVGMTACVAFAVVSLGLPDVSFTPLAAAVACMAASAALTGAAHERQLKALTGDSLVVTFTLMGKAALVAMLAARSPGAVLTALLAAHTVSRLWPLVLMRLMPPAEIERLDRRALGVALAWCAVPVILMALAHGMVFAFGGLIMSGAATWGLRFWLRAKGRAFSSEALGSAQQLSEAAFYLGAGFGLSSP